MKGRKTKKGKKKDINNYTEKSEISASVQQCYRLTPEHQLQNENLRLSKQYSKKQPQPQYSISRA